MDFIDLTQAQLEERLAYWQKQLRLQDWDVEIRMVRRFEAGDHEGSMAYVEVYLPKRHARINFIEPRDVDPEGWPVESMERSLVHELLHLHMWPFNPEDDTPAYTAMEQAVHALAGALVES